MKICVRALKVHDVIKLMFLINSSIDIYIHVLRKVKETTVFL